MKRARTLGRSRSVLRLLGMGMLAVWGPSCIKFADRPVQNECKRNLKAWFTAERAYMQEKDIYSPRVAEVGFAPERGNRYAYFAGRGPVEERLNDTLVAPPEAEAIGVDLRTSPSRTPIALRQIPQDIAREVGLTGTCPKCQISMVCAGQLDTDPLLDVWSISTQERTMPDGTQVPAGEPFHHIDDAEY